MELRAGLFKILLQHSKNNEWKACKATRYRSTEYFRGENQLWAESKIMLVGFRTLGFSIGNRFLRK